MSNINTSSSTIVIIGSGLAGYTLARELRKHNQEIPIHIITADDGSYYSKPLLSSAISHKKTAQQLAMMSPTKTAEQFNATIHTHTIVTQIDPQQQQITTNKFTLSYGQLVIACGAVPAQPNLTGDAADEVHSINDLQDYTQFRAALEGKKHIAIIGSGLVGCEFTNDLMNGGYDVTLISSAINPLDRLLPPDLGTIFKHGMIAKGLNLISQRKVAAVNRQSKQYRLHFNENESIDVDLAIRAIGLRPQTILAKAAGLNVNLGIVVNRYLRTNIPNIYAIGDCAEVEGLSLLYLAPLVLSARALAKTLSGEETKVNYPAMPIYVKTPACPVISALPPMGLKTPGNWNITTENYSGTGLFYNDNNELTGFSLVGTATTQCNTLAKQLPPMLS